jgi:hypothetical protein
MDSEVDKFHAEQLEDSHDQLLQRTLENGSYNRLHSFKHIVNGFAVHTTPSQVLSHLFNFALYISSPQETEKGLLKKFPDMIISGQKTQSCSRRNANRER